jgi:hypothetical protein
VTIRRPALIGALLTALVLPASAEAGIPSYSDQVYAKRFARDWWASREWGYGDGVPNCYGVRFQWRSFRYEFGLKHRLAFVHPSHPCTIFFNRNVHWYQVPIDAHPRPGEMQFLDDDWWRLCATAIHEWGHLPGMPYNWLNPPIHSRNPNNVMNGYEVLNTRAWWWPFFPGCRYEGDGIE